MHNIVYNEKKYTCRDDETVLEALLRQGLEASFSCRKGSCQVCILKCCSGDVSGESQESLRPVFIDNDFFLPCQCKPTGDLEIRDIDRDEIYTPAYVHKKEYLSENVCRLLIECNSITDYQPGQFINLSRPSDGLTRSYSLASCQDEDYFIELHIQRMDGGELSNWIFDELNELDEIEVQGPNGDCYYQEGLSAAPILMAASNTGLAPIVGILRQSIMSRHTGNIYVYHECKTANDLYLNEFMQNIAEKYENIHYIPCVLESNDDSLPAQTAASLIASDHGNFSEWLVYLSGSDRMVSKLYAQVIKKGATTNLVFTDSFDLKDLRKNDEMTRNTHDKNITKDNLKSSNHQLETGYPAPDPEIWECLNNGKTLNLILHDFYTIVYDDPKLAPFFTKITKQRSIEKSYLFLRQVITGEKVYIGDRPRNAHHWMVITNEIFDYREAIMKRCLQEHGLPEHIINRLIDINESFRKDIVKTTPWNKIVNGIEIPADGFEEIEIDSGTVCDSCQQAVESGETVRYHTRLGEVYCSICMSGDN